MLIPFLDVSSYLTEDVSAVPNYGNSNLSIVIFYYRLLSTRLLLSISIDY